MLNEKWRKLTAQKEEIKLNDELTITVTGLSVKELGTLGGFQDSKDTVSAMNYILKRTFEKAPEFEDKSMVDEFVDSLDAKVGIEVVKAVQRLSGFDVKEPKN